MILLLCLLQASDAESLLKQLEEKLVSAKTLQVSIQGETTFTKADQKATAAMSGTLKVKGPAKYLFAGTMEQGKQKIEVTLTSDGTTAKEVAGDVTRSLTPVKDFSGRAGALLARFGFLPAQVLRLRNEDIEPQEKDADFLPDARKLVKVEGAKAVVESGVTTITLTAIYRRTGEETDTRVAVTLVLGADGLPTKRVVKHSMEAITVEVVETYAGWKIDAELADTVFDVKK